MYNPYRDIPEPRLEPPCYREEEDETMYDADFSLDDTEIKLNDGYVQLQNYLMLKEDKCRIVTSKIWGTPEQLRNMANEILKQLGEGK